VSPEKEIAYCFGCHKGGDIFGFYQSVEGVDFVTAMKSLAEKAGVQLKESSFNSAAMAKSKDAKQTMLDIHTAATEIYQRNLQETPEGQKVLQYVKSRGITDEFIQKFKFGFALDSFDQVYKELLHKGFSKSDIVESGIAVAKDTDMVSIYDRFRLRLMIPIMNKDSKVIGFGGRALKADEAAKYLNSPETLIYHKSEVLFGFNFAKEAIRQQDSVVVVEGYFDQIAPFQAGFQNVVAVSGTALTPRHLQLLKKYTNNIYFCFDSDSAGKAALYRSAELALVEGFSIKVLNLGNFKDPAEVIKDDPAKFKVAFELAKDIFDRILELEFLSVEEEKRYETTFIIKFLELVLPILQKVSSPILLDVIIRKLASNLKVKSDFVYQELQKHKSMKFKDPVSKAPVNPKAVIFGAEDYFWAYLFWYPNLFENLYPEIQNFDFIFAEKQVYKLFEDNYNNRRDLSELSLVGCDLPEITVQKLSIAGVYLESVASEDWNEDNVKNELARLLMRLKQEYKKEQGLKLESEIRLAEKEKDFAKLKELLDRHRQVLSL
jgi:DNA primase